MQLLIIRLIFLLVSLFPALTSAATPMVACGDSHTIALKSDGTVVAWGNNMSGQLGDGTTTQRLNPVVVPNLSGVVAVAASIIHTLALKSDGTVKSWGDNSNGQLGDGTTTQQINPVTVPNLSGIIAVAAGLTHSVALKSDGTVVAWGSNVSGQLGDGTTIQRLTPVAVPISGVIAISAGFGHTIALKSNGTVVTWGSNGTGQLGDGTTALHSSPAAVPNLTNVIAVSAGAYHSIALKSDGTIVAWGNNLYGQLGDGTTTQHLSPVAVPNLTGIISVSAGMSHTVALKSDGTVVAWGYNSNGQLGDGTTTQRSSPFVVPNLTDVVSLSAGFNYTTALKSDGSMLTWGSNLYGQLGNHSSNNRLTPIVVHDAQNVNYLSVTNDTGSIGCATCSPVGWTSLVTPPNVAGVAVGANQSYAIRSDGSLWGWGDNAYGQLGDSILFNHKVAVNVAGISHVVSVAGSSYRHTLALTSNGTVWSWGSNAFGQLGDSTTTDHSTPMQIAGLTDIVAIAVSDESSYALKSDGTVWAWGRNSHGQLGDGTTADHPIPATVRYLSGVKSLLTEQISFGGNVVHALKADGTVWLWGATSGYDQTLPEPEGSLDGVGGIAAIAGSGNLILKIDGTVWNKSSGTLSQVSGLSSVSAIAAGTGDSNYALKSDGSVWAWGNNQFGQIGDGTTINAALPKQVISSGVVALSAQNDANHVLALTLDGSVLAWGNNSNGQLGDNTNLNRLLPISVHDAQNLNYLNATNSTSSTGCATCSPLSWSTLEIPSLAAGVAVGANQSYVIFGDGSLWSWGDNSYGQLGDGTISSRKVAVKVAGLSNIVAVAGSHYQHALALTVNGKVWSWGRNTYGQLGDSTLTDHYAPEQIPGLIDVVSVAVGSDSSYALKSDGTVWSWGRNNNGQLGDGTTTDSSVPQIVRYLSGVKTLFTDMNAVVHVLKADGTVWSWGNGVQAQPELDAALLGVTGIVTLAYGSNHVLVLKNDNTIWSYGNNDYGQLGIGNTAASVTFIQVGTLSNVAAIAAGANSSYALKTDGSLWSWGENGKGQLGDGTTANQLLPKQIVTSGVTAMSALNNAPHLLVLKTDGSVLAWGDNSFSQLGDNTALPRLLPTLVHDSLNMNDLNATNPTGSSGCVTCAPVGWQTLSLPAGSPAIAVGSNGSYGVMADGSLWSWGKNEPSMSGTATTQPLPMPIPNLSNLLAVADAQGQYTLALKSDGSVWSWGTNSFGQLGDSSLITHLTPVQTPEISNAVMVAVGNNSSYAVKSDGSVWAWGNNDSGQLGDNSTINRSVPEPIAGLSDVVSVTVGLNSVFALKADGTVWAWGQNSVGQLGDGTTIDHFTPAKVRYLAGVISLLTRAGTIYALKADGTVWSWGSGIQQPELEAALLSVANITALAAGTSHMLALKKDGTVWSYGDNTFGQLGDGSTNSSENILRQALTLTNVKSIGAAGNTSYAVKSDGSVWAWGINNYGQLGDGTFANRPYPAPLVNNQSAGLFDLTPIDGLEQATLAAKPAVMLTAIESTTLKAIFNFDAETQNKVGFVYITAYLPENSPLFSIKTTQSIAQASQNYAPMVQQMAATSGLVPAVLTSTGWKQINGTATTEALFTGTLNTLAATYTLYNVTSFDRTSTAGVFCAGYSLNGNTMGLTRAVITGNNTITDCPQLNVVPAVPASTLGIALSGSGKVTSIPANIDCGNICTMEYVNGTSLTLTATPSAGYSFTGWSGGGCNGTGACNISINAAATVQATFDISSVNGVCGSSHTATLITAPSSGLCTSGIASTVVGSGPWDWSCSGSNGGITAQCSASLQGDANFTAALNLKTGWNLVGNSVNFPLNVAANLNAVNQVITVWKWNPLTAKWAFYTPDLTSDNLLAYATSKGYEVLTLINGGEGFWINAKINFTMQLPTGVAINSSKFSDQASLLNNLPKGWSLIAVGDNPTPRDFINTIALTKPVLPDVASNSLTSMWAWSNAASKWYFYAPGLDNSNGLINYISSKGYLDFSLNNPLLDPTMGFWVNHP
jgi:alpha-tubulin suppressor-like RCC1 family protein